MATQYAKPRLSPAACRLFYRIVAYVRRYGVDRKTLPHAASDVMDGAYLGYDPEVRELKRKGLILTYHVGGYWNGGWTWHLTDEGCEAVARTRPAPAATGE